MAPRCSADQFVDSLLRIIAQFFAQPIAGISQPACQTSDFNFQARARGFDRDAAQTHTITGVDLITLVAGIVDQGKFQSCLFFGLGQRPFDHGTVNHDFATEGASDIPCGLAFDPIFVLDIDAQVGADQALVQIVELNTCDFEGAQGAVIGLQIGFGAAEPSRATSWGVSEISAVPSSKSDPLIALPASEVLTA